MLAARPRRQEARNQLAGTEWLTKVKNMVSESSPRSTVTGSSGREASAAARGGQSHVVGVAEGAGFGADKGHGAQDGGAFHDIVCYGGEGLMSHLRPSVCEGSHTVAVRACGPFLLIDSTPDQLATLAAVGRLRYRLHSHLSCAIPSQLRATSCFLIRCSQVGSG